MAPSLSLAMSQIIAHDAPLLSPTDPSWEFSPTDAFAYTLPPSPPLSDPAASPAPPTAMLRMRSDPDPDDLCVPTHQLFDFPQELVQHHQHHQHRPPTPPSRSPSFAARLDNPDHDDDRASSCGTKRSASPAPSAAKKRAIGERISSKDFVPPDVSGLSKREARLVKNRAAAFLSRQRKREEFECMEVRVAELEQENARLLALTQPQTPPQLLSEVEQLKAQLAAAKERERTLSAQLASKHDDHPPVKQEASDADPAFLFSSSSSSAVSTTRNSLSSAPHKSGASLGLMVLLCALPSLLSMRMQSAAPTSFSIPNPFPASSATAFDYTSYLPADYDWSRTSASLMDMDMDAAAAAAPAPSSRVKKLQFTGTDAEELGGLGDLDISFESSPADDGKIRVRIHPPSSGSSSSSSSGSSRGASPAGFEPSLSMWDSPVGGSTYHSDPFLGAAGDFGMPFAADGSLRYDYGGLSSSSSSSSYPPSNTYFTSSTSSTSPYALQTSFSTSQNNNNGGASPMSMSSGSSLSSPTALEFGASHEALLAGLGSQEFSVPDAGSSGGAKRRVRIALKSMPQSGGAEGGEWEVQIC
ncbi:hypothetical protein BDN70DRAFT_902800 [Pholiota conissans]|uniref:BZIP domain-containing protein n=1 Tax=Pholiota conissans TaxID=109636 RepID=A0A9P6D6X7_9AGAR|nr:hypothetical protein BDN70DRAFT_902800 [Pholiota conissans]